MSLRMKRNLPLILTLVTLVIFLVMLLGAIPIVAYRI